MYLNEKKGMLVLMISFVIKNLLRYRKEVIEENLKNVKWKLPININDVKSEYYGIIGKYITEIMAVFTMSEKKLLNKVQLEQESLTTIEKMDKKKRIILLSNHLGNWELVSMALPRYLKRNVIGVYKPLSNKYLDKILNSNRKRFGLQLAEMSEILRCIASHETEGQAYLFINDQSPQKNAKGAEIEFLGRPTKFYNGIEKINERYDCDNYYIKVSPKTDVYFIGLEKIEKPLLINYAQKLERDIHEFPSYWLWSHRRWK
jgi:KDO2-lipid IV(A) lauroyltransferase